MTRSKTRKVLGDITTSSNIYSKNPKVTVGKKSVPVPKNGKQFRTLRPNSVTSISKNLSLLSVNPGPEERLLPPGVKDVDAEDGDNPQLCSEYATETFVYLKQLEKRYTVRANHLAECPTNEKMRLQLINWLAEVQEEFELTPETFYLAVNVTDR